MTVSLSLIQGLKADIYGVLKLYVEEIVSRSIIPLVLVKT